MKELHNNKYILAIETTSKICGIAISNNDQIIYESNLDNGLNHSISLFVSINKALSKSSIGMSQIKKIKISSGPGSFTGIRIGIAAALGLSTYYNTNIEYIDTLDTFCFKEKNKCDLIISLIDAKSNRAYMSLYDGRNLKKLINDCVINIDDLIHILNKHFTKKNANFIFVGDGALTYKDNFIKLLSINFKIDLNNTNIKSSNLIYTKGTISHTPQINYILASKAERDKFDKN